jgi:hypothetical protein
LTDQQVRRLRLRSQRLAGEPAGGVPDIHFSPGAPRSVLGGVAVRF